MACLQAWASVTSLEEWQRIQDINIQNIQKNHFNPNLEWEYLAYHPLNISDNLLVSIFIKYSTTTFM